MAVIILASSELLIVQAMAKAMALSDGRDPYGRCRCETNHIDGTLPGWLHEVWQDYEIRARNQRAAHVAMLIAEKDESAG